MSTLTFSLERPTDGSMERTVEVARIANCGFTGRSEADVRAHIDELEEEGIPTPDDFPAVYPKPHHLITTNESIEVVSPRTSGEAEFVLFPLPDETLVGVGSDHTDRELEQTDIVRSKAICPNVVSDSVWALSDIQDHWDEIRLRSFTDDELYQDATLEAILPPDNLITLIADQTSAAPVGTAVFSGSVGTETSELVYADEFRVELHDPVLERSLEHTYRVQELDWVG